MPISDLELRLRLNVRDLSSVKIFARQCALLEERLAAVDELRLSLEIFLGLLTIQFGLLQFLWDTGLRGSLERSLSLFEASAIFCYGGGDISIFERGK